MAKRLKKGIFILYADMDNLKWINDTFGHQEGDRALQATKRILGNVAVIQTSSPVSEGMNL